MNKIIKSILIIILIVLVTILIMYEALRLYIKYNSIKVVDRINQINIYDENNKYPEISSIELEEEKTNDEISYFGYNAIGAIYVPKINISYPILDTLNSTTMKIGAVRAYGANLNDGGISILVSHNYMDGSLFSNISKLTNGDSIFITDTSGKKVEYVVYSTFITDPKDTSYYNLNTDGKSQIALATCTNDLKNEFIVLAKEK